MKVAIVGTSHIQSDQQKNDVRQIISKILKDYDAHTTTIVTGGANGVDSIAGNIALLNGFAYKPIFPMGTGTKANLARNLEIAKDCDHLFCISTPVHHKKCYHHKPSQDHEKTAGCWTMKKALEMNKECKLLVTPNRISEIEN